jgi:hypothetical protein
MRIFPLIILFLFSQIYAQEQQSEADKRAALLGTVQVSRVHSLDEVKGSYKSPRKAMFMSLVLPGSGQIYVGGTQSRYVRGVFYLAEEIALISGLYYHSIYKYDKQVEKYKNFANSNFSVSRYEKAMNDIYNESYKENFLDLYWGERESYCKAFYGNNGYAKECSDYSNFNRRRQPSDNESPFNISSYYSIITNETFIFGWKDAIPEDKNSIITNLNSLEYKRTIQETSEMHKEYISLRKKASDYADRQALFLGGIILNHIVSAIDAALSARAHNNSLYEEKVSFLDKVRLGSGFQAGENFRAEAGLRFIF